MKINESILMYHKMNRYDQIFSKRELTGKRNHIKNMIPLALLIAPTLNYDIDSAFLAICSEHHDDGRADQYELLGNFNDAIITHNVLSIHRLNQFLLEHEIKETDDSIQIFRDVLFYHGKTTLVTLSKESKPYVEIITLADNFENAFSCVSYLLKEVETDAKGYQKKNPYADQKKVSPYVWKCFCEGKKFNKLKYCTSYAEYVLFATLLAIDSIINYETIAKLAFSQLDYDVSSILEGYQTIFHHTLSPEMEKEAYQILFHTFEKIRN